MKLAGNIIKAIIQLLLFDFLFMKNAIVYFTTLEKIKKFRIILNAEHWEPNDQREATQEMKAEIITN